MARQLPEKASHFRKYGFAYLLLFLFIGAVTGYYNQHWAYERSEYQTQCEFLHAQDPQAQCPEVQPADVRTSFWDGIWENNQSEMVQLLIQFLGMVAFARWVAYKEQETDDEIKAMLMDIQERLPSAS